MLPAWRGEWRSRACGGGYIDHAHSFLYGHHIGRLCAKRAGVRTQRAGQSICAQVGARASFGKQRSRRPAPRTSSRQWACALCNIGRDNSPRRR